MTVYQQIATDNPECADAATRSSSMACPAKSQRVPPSYAAQIQWSQIARRRWE